MHKKLKIHELAFLLLEISRELSLVGRFISVLGREVLNIKNVVIFAVLGCPWARVNKKEFRFNFLHAFTLCQIVGTMSSGPGSLT